MQTVLKQIKTQASVRNEKEKSVGILAKIFGCWHQDLGRPFTTNRKSYRACLNCGARKHFNPETLETFGRFYFQPSIAENYN